MLPELKGKVVGIALKVPVADGSNVDLVAVLGRAVTAEEVNTALREAAAESTVIGYTEDPIVSSDVIGSSYSATVDGLMTSVMDGTMLKMVIWFDNGWGYAARILEAIETAASWEGVSA